MKQAIILFILSATIFTSCEQVDEYTHFNFDNTERIELPYPIVANEPVEILTPKKDMDSESTLVLYSTKKDRIEDVRCSNITIQMVSPETADLSFLEKVDVYIYGPNTPEERVAYAESIPDNVGTELRLTTVDLNLYKFLKDDYFRLRVVVTADKDIDEAYVVDAYSFYEIDAKILGQ